MPDDRIVEIHWGDKIVPVPKPLLWVIVAIATVLGSLWALPKVGINIFGDKVAIPRAQAIQFEQAQRHLGETPEKEVVLRDDALGREVVRTFSSDRSTLNIKSPTGGRPVATWILEPRPDGERSIVVGDLSFASAALAQGRCLDPTEHPGSPEKWVDPPDSAGWQVVWNRWRDGCTLYFRFNVVTGQFEADENGDPHYVWTYCVH